MRHIFIYIPFVPLTLDIWLHGIGAVEGTPVTTENLLYH